jgi:hypothetical protein
MAKNLKKACGFTEVANIQHSRHQIIIHCLKNSKEYFIGDYIIPNRVNNGVGIAVSPEKISSEDVKNIIGVAWSSSATDLQINLINVAVGINTNDNSKQVTILEKKLNDQDTEISVLKKQTAETNTL